MSATEDPRSVGLPVTTFLYTLDQVTGLLQLTAEQAKTAFFFEGRQVGARKKSHLVAINVAADDEVPVWRVSEHELVRWMRHKGFYAYATYEVESRPRTQH